MVRTRSAAAALVEAGHVRVNGARIAAASYAVRAGDVVTLALDRGVNTGLSSLPAGLNFL